MSFLTVCCIPASPVMTPDSPSEVHHHPTLHATTGVRLTDVQHSNLAYSGLVGCLRLC